MFFHKKHVQPASCRRELERNPIPDSESLVVELDLPTGDMAPADLYDLTIEGSAVIVPEDLVADLLEDDVLQFTLAHPMHGWSVCTPAKVVRKAPQGPNQSLVGLQFINTGSLYSQLDNAMGLYFTRRKLNRVHPDKDKVIPVKISDGATQYTGTIYDLSTEGMGFTLPKEDGLKLHPDMPLSVAFVLPNSEDLIQGEISVRQRRKMQDLAFVGALFGEQFERFADSITDYVSMRRLEAIDFEEGFEDPNSGGDDEEAA
ncbi:MAG: PilZ domain-containing protein [Planctomycetota bacterium]|nr:PilZ domain-containing protein [Planctomycetota bacterium]